MTKITWPHQPGLMNEEMGFSALPSAVRTLLTAPLPTGGLRAIRHLMVVLQEGQSFDFVHGALKGVRGLGENPPTALPVESVATHLGRADLPLAYALADAFTVCDAFHCSVNGPSLPNRNHLFSGTTGFEPDGTTRAVTDAGQSHDHDGFDWTTYPERLERAGVSWQVYQEWDNGQGNPLEFFARFKTIGQRILKQVDGTYRTTLEFHQLLPTLSPERRRLLLAQFDQGVANLSPGDRQLFIRGLSHSAPGTLLSRITDDISAGTLPRVSWIIPPGGTSAPVQADLIHDLLDVVAGDGPTWSSTAILINVDCDGGHLDHIPPPLPPRPDSGKSADWAGGQPIGLGRRVPLTVISPWTIGGHVNSEVFDHTSILQLMELVTDVREPNISDWRRQACGDLTSVFDFEARHAVDDQPPARLGDIWPSGQEPGRRFARPLRYRPSVAAAIVAGAVEVTLANGGAGSVHFTLYPYAGKRALRPIHLDVDGIHTERVPITTKEYRFLVQGPNRFFYELAGRIVDRASALQVGTRVASGRGALDVQLRNHGCDQLTIRLQSIDYTAHSQTVSLRGGRFRTFSWPTEHGWYDLEVTVDTEPAFYRRLTGRVEDGSAGLTG